MARSDFHIVGRYMDGAEVIGYHVNDISTGENRMYTREQIIYLVGAKAIANCTGQLYKSEVLLRGKDINLNSLPVITASGEIKNSDSLGKIKKKTGVTDAVNQLRLVARSSTGKNGVYEIQNAGGATKVVGVEEFIGLASKGMIGNITYQNYQNKPIVKGIGFRLKDLPEIQNLEQKLRAVR